MKDTKEIVRIHYVLSLSHFEYKVRFQSLYMSKMNSTQSIYAEFFFWNDLKHLEKAKSVNEGFFEISLYCKVRAKNRLDKNLVKNIFSTRF